MESNCKVTITSFAERHSQTGKLAKVTTVAAERTDEQINVWSIVFIVSPTAHTHPSAVWGHSLRWEHTWLRRCTHFSSVVCVCVCARSLKEVRVARPLRNLYVSIWDGGEVKGEWQTFLCWTSRCKSRFRVGSKGKWGLMEKVRGCFTFIQMCCFSDSCRQIKAF